MLHNQMILKCIIYFWDIKENQFLSNERYHLYVKLKKIWNKNIHLPVYKNRALCMSNSKQQIIYRSNEISNFSLVIYLFYRNGFS